MDLIPDQLFRHTALSFLLTHKVEADAGTVYCISARPRHQFKLQFLDSSLLLNRSVVQKYQTPTKANANNQII